MKKIKRYRDKQLLLRLTSSEKNAIISKFKLSQEKNLSDFILKAVLKMYIINIDLSSILYIADSINKIGVNINQITKNANINKYIPNERLNILEDLLQQVISKENEILNKLTRE